LPLVGRLIDRYGVRWAIVVIGATFGAVLVALSMVSGIFGLTAGFVGIRLAGQGALGLAAVTVVSHWFSRRRGTALGVVTAIGASGISLAPILIERLIAFHGWRSVWLMEGVAVWAIVVPIAILGIRNRPRDVGQHVDGDPAPAAGHRLQRSVGRAVAMRTPYFWVLVAGVSTSGMLGTAVIFHQISLLGERGLTSAQAAATFLPMTAAGIVATLLVGHLIDRYDHPRLLVVVSMALLGIGLAWATVLTPGWSALAYGAVMGASANAIRAVEAALTPRMFGTGQLASIRSILAAVGVASTAVGPLMFAAAHDATGGYTAVLLASIALPAGVVAAAVTVRLPDPADPLPTTPVNA
jgi:MFS family permease